MADSRSALRFTFDPARLAPDWPNRSESEAEWRRVWEHFHPRLDEHFREQTRDAALADEVVSHVFRRALLRLHEIAAADAAWNWMCRTGRNHLIDLHRRQQAQGRLHAGYQAEIVGTGDDVVPADIVLRLIEPDKSDDDGRIRLPIDRATYEARLAQLSPEDLRLLHLIELEGKTHVEAARELGIQPATSRKRHSRARYFVREGKAAP